MRGLIAFLFLTPMLAHSVESCDISTEGVNLYEQRLLLATDKEPSARWPAMIPSLECLFQIHQKGDGSARYLAGSYLRQMFGGAPVKGYSLDPRYRKLSQIMLNRTLGAKDLVGMSLASEFAKGDWGFYRLMCEEGDRSFCPAFLPTEDRVKAEAPMVAATSMLALRNAYLSLSGKEKEQVAATIKSLYLHTDQNSDLKRRLIDQIYLELFSPAVPLSLG